jgi:hypothetical protein
MSDNAYKLGRAMVWSNTAGLYMRSFRSGAAAGEAAPRESVAANGFGHRPHESPELNLDHLYRMTDSTGIFQHASFTAPNHSEGYCTDDNARALILAVLLGQLEEAPKRVRALATTYAAFLDLRLQSKNGAFPQFPQYRTAVGSMSGDPKILMAGRSGRWAPRWGARRIGVRRRMAEQLFAQALPAVLDFTSPRAWAFSLIGIHEYLRRMKGDRLAFDVREELTARLVAIFDKVAGARLDLV